MMPPDARPRRTRSARAVGRGGVFWASGNDRALASSVRISGGDGSDHGRGKTFSPFGAQAPFTSRCQGGEGQLGITEEIREWSDQPGGKVLSTPTLS